jgi:hypothetical protein
LTAEKSSRSIRRRSHAISFQGVIAEAATPKFYSLAVPGWVLWTLLILEEPALLV